MIFTRRGARAKAVLARLLAKNNLRWVYQGNNTVMCTCCGALAFADGQVLRRIDECKPQCEWREAEEIVGAADKG